MIIARFLFGETLKNPQVGQERYSVAMQTLHDAYVMQAITKPAEEVLFGHVLSMMRRVDLGNLPKNTKYIRIREKNK